MYFTVDKNAKALRPEREYEGLSAQVVGKVQRMAYSANGSLLALGEWLRPASLLVATRGIGGSGIPALALPDSALSLVGRPLITNTAGTASGALLLLEGLAPFAPRKLIPGLFQGEIKDIDVLQTQQSIWLVATDDKGKCKAGAHSAPSVTTAAPRLTPPPPPPPPPCYRQIVNGKSGALVQEVLAPAAVGPNSSVARVRFTSQPEEGLVCLMHSMGPNGRTAHLGLWGCVKEAATSHEEPEDAVSTNGTEGESRPRDDSKHVSWPHPSSVRWMAGLPHPAADGSNALSASAPGLHQLQLDPPAAHSGASGGGNGPGGQPLRSVLGHRYGGGLGHGLPLRQAPAGQADQGGAHDRRHGHGLLPG